MSKIMLTADEEKDILDFYSKHSIGETAKKFNLSKQVISRVLRNNGVAKHEGSCRRVISDEDKQFIINNFNDFSDSFFMKKLKIHSKHYYAVLNELGLFPRTHEENVKLGVIKSEKTCFKKYGSEHPSQSDDVKNKVRETCLKKYGTECALQATIVKEKCKQTCLEKYGVEHPLQAESVKNKQAQTCLEKYGVECFLQTNEARSSLEQYRSEHSAEIREKISNTNLARYGYKVAISSEEVKQKMIKTQTEHYGGMYVNTDEFKAIKAAKRASSLEKAAATNLEKYGNKNYFCTDDFKQKLYITKKKNNSFNVSNTEEKTFLILCSLLGEDDIIRQYSDDRYPFACDFYIKSRDLFVELNITWTHGGKLFTGDEADMIKLNKWKEKSAKSDFYKNAIITWTVRDIKKNKYAKDNNLNYICLYTEEEIKEWLLTLQ